MAFSRLGQVLEATVKGVAPIEVYVKREVIEKQKTEYLGRKNLSIAYTPEAIVSFRI